MLGICSAQNFPGGILKGPPILFLLSTSLTLHPIYSVLHHVINVVPHVQGSVLPFAQCYTLPHLATHLHTLCCAPCLVLHPKYSVLHPTYLLLHPVCPVLLPRPASTTAGM